MESPRALKIFGDVRKGEGVTTFLLMTNIFVVLAGYYVCKTVREPLILIGGGAEMKSYAAAEEQSDPVNAGGKPRVERHKPHQEQRLPRRVRKSTRLNKPPTRLSYAPAMCSRRCLSGWVRRCWASVLEDLPSPTS